jgi:hypothetical protein
MTGIIEKLPAMRDFWTLEGVMSTQITEAEQQLALHFSEEYRDYLAAFGVASVYGHELTGICSFPRLNVVDVTLSERITNPTVPLDWYVVEQAHIDAIIIWQSSNGEVHQTAPNMPPIMLSQSICEYLANGE